MKNRRSLLLMLPLLCFFFCGCEQIEGIPFEAVEFIISGADDIKLERKGRRIVVAMGQAGGTLTFEACGKNAANGFIESIQTSRLNDYFEQFRTHQHDNQTVFPYIFAENEALKVTVLSDNPHITQISLKENVQAQKISHAAKFGCVFTITEVTITQEGKRQNEE